ncbi:MAG: NAD(P)-dependent oxidoreductase [Actinomycetota bacterium]|nr:NAD(P)-dependent oxidoreductase [Actinomycetota bacterium]
MNAPPIAVGFAGLGRMGVPMAGQLITAGFDVTVYNRTSATASAFAAEHASQVAATPRELAAISPIVVTMVADGNALLALLDGDDGLLAGVQPGGVVVDMGTTGLEHTQLVRARLAERNVELVEAPVSGSVAAARAKTLLVMAAGEPRALDAVMPILDAMAGTIIRVGGPGAGAAMKLAVNAVLFGLNQAIAESLVLAERAGIDRITAYEVFASSAVAAPVVHYRRAVFEQPGTTPVTFSIDLAVKDLGLIAHLASSVGTTMPQADANLDVMRRASSAGLGNADMGEVATFIRRTPPAPTEPLSCASQVTTRIQSAAPPSVDSDTDRKGSSHR